MKKLLIGVLVVLLLTGCGDKSKETVDTDAIFKDALIAVSKIGDATGKILPNEILIEDVEEVFEGIFDLAIFESSNVEYGEITQGAGSDGNGGRVFCCKLPVNVKFVGSEASVEKFVEYFSDVKNVVSFGDFKVETLEDEKYKVTTLINFLGKATGGTLSGGKKEYTIKKNEIEVKKEEEVKLREYDLFMIIRPSNSDSAAVSLGVIDDKDYRIYSDENDRKDITAIFSNDGSKYYCEYKISDEDVTKVLIKPNGNILFDILSCEIIEADDDIAVDLHIINNSNKKVSVAIFDDEDERVSIVEKVGSIEVKK